MYKRSREFARRMRSYRGEFAPGNPRFTEDSPAAAREQDGPVDISAPDIVYSKEDDEVIDKWHRATGEWSCLSYVSREPYHLLVQTAWHSVSFPLKEMLWKLTCISTLAAWNLCHETAR